jgi:hypothetical protein
MSPRLLTWLVDRDIAIVRDISPGALTAAVIAPEFTVPENTPVAVFVVMVVPPITTVDGLVVGA